MGMFPQITYAPGNGNELLLSDRTIREKRNGEVIRLENYRIEMMDENYPDEYRYKMVINKDSSNTYISRKDSLLTLITCRIEPEVYTYRHVR